MACSLLLCPALSLVFPTLPHPLCEVGGFLNLGLQTPRPEALSLPSPGLSFPPWPCITDRLRSGEALHIPCMPFCVHSLIAM